MDSFWDLLRFRRTVETEAGHSLGSFGRGYKNMNNLQELGN